MLKLVIPALFFAAVSASGRLAALAPAYGYHATAPVLAAATPVVHAPLATSYSNTYKVSVKAPLVHTAPVAYAATPIAHYAAAQSLAYPFAYGKPYGYGFHY